MTEYRDFEIAVSADGDEIFAQVNSPAGESDRVAVKLPFKADKAVLRLESAIQGRTRKSRKANLLESDLRSIGEGLFRSLLLDPKQIQQLYTNSRVLLPEGARLRFKLRVGPDSLAALPWEYFYDDLVIRDYLGLHAQSSLVRYAPMATPIRRLAVDGPLRILGMVANPRKDSGYAALDVTTERERIDKAIRKLHESGDIDFQWVLGETVNELQDKLANGGPWHAFHFIGHGGLVTDTGEGFIVLADESGAPNYITGINLRRLLGWASSLRLVVLNCCDSGRGPTSVAKTLVAGNIPAVLAMQYPISDMAAIEMSSGFYNALANGETVDGAVSSARMRMKLKSDTEWGIPILHMRSADGRLFERPQPLQTLPAADAPKPVAADAKPPAPVAAAFDGLDGLLDTREAELSELLHSDADLSTLAVERLAPLADLGERRLAASSGDERLRKRVAAVHFQLCGRYRGENVNKAFVSISTAIKLDPLEPNYVFTRADMFARGDQLDLAMGDMNQALQLAPDRAEYYWAKGVLCMLGARAGLRPELLTEAVAAFDGAIKLQPTVAKFHSSRGAAQHGLGRLVEAMRDLDIAIQLDPTDSRGYYNRAQLRQQTGDIDSALSDLETATRLGHTLASRELQRLQSERGTRH